MEQRREERGAFLAWELLGRVRSAVNESVMVRSEERGIYNPSENLTVQIYVGSSDADLGTLDVVDRISSVVLRGVSHEGRLIDSGA